MSGRAENFVNSLGSENGARRGKLAPGELLARLRLLATDQSHQSIARRVAGAAFMMRAASAALVYVSQVLFARWMGKFEFGVYVYVWTWLLLAGSFMPLGLSSTAQRFIPEYSARGEWGLLRGFLVASRAIPIALGFAALALSAFLLWAIGDLAKPYYIIPLLLAATCLPVHGASDVLGGIARSYNWVNVAIIPAYILRPLLILVAMAGIYFAGIPLTAVVAMVIAAGAYWLTTTGQFFAINRGLKREVPAGPRVYQLALWLKTALPIFMVESFYFLLSYTDILVLDLFVGPEEVAVYYAATKTLAMVAFVYFSVAAATSHRFSEYHTTGERDKLEAFLHQSVRWVFWPSLAITIVFLALGKPLLNLFGAGYEHGYPWMFVLAIGLMARASVGPVERLLNMVGEQKLCAAVYAGTFAINLALCFILIPRIGPMGAAVATASAMVTESLLLFVLAKKRLGLHVFVWQPKKA
jgi:O-antigen/teichoic acid export membrane protein